MTTEEKSTLAEGEGESSDAAEKSLLTQFKPGLFVGHRSWLSLDRILKSRGGGSYGLAGPRGAGKTWMMEKALHEAEAKDGVAVWFPSPSEYEPTAFLAALSDVVAARYQAYYDKLTRRPTRAAFGRFLRYLFGGLLMLMFVSVMAARTAEFESPTRVTSGALFGLPVTFGDLFLWALGFAGIYLIAKAFIRLRQDRSGLGRVRSEAEDLRRQVRYTVSASENTEIGLSAGHSGITGALKRARERRLVERPATLSSLIHNFRAFVEEMAQMVPGQIVIAIDELDKMSDSARVAQLFRDIKGIFEIRGAYFLVSLSDEAARALGLGGIRARNEFNSSFYTVISIPALPPAQCVDLLRERDSNFDCAVASAIGVITGGVPREVVRVAEALRVQGHEHSMQEAMSLAMDEQLQAFGDGMLTAREGDEGTIGDAALTLAFEALHRAKAALGDDLGDFPPVAREAWDLNASNPTWNQSLAEEWRRLLVRLAIAWLLAMRPYLVDDEGEALALQQIAIATANSAAVGRLRLEAFLATRGDVLEEAPASR